jgi:hypothetical protein
LILRNPDLRELRKSYENVIPSVSNNTKNLEDFNLPPHNLSNLEIDAYLLTLHNQHDTQMQDDFEIEQFDHIQEAADCQQKLLAMNIEQRSAFDFISTIIDRKLNEEDLNSNETCCFIDAPGGTGKTFLLNAILSKVRSLRATAVATAFSGIAANLLKGGRTTHSTFKLPIPIDPQSSCAVSRGSTLGQLLINSLAIVIDEAPMMQIAHLQAINRLLTQLMKCDKPFGGKLMILAGDFRQVTPILPQADKAKIISQCIKHDITLWHNFHIFKLRTNQRVMRITANLPEAEIHKCVDFANWLLQIGDHSNALQKLSNDDRDTRIVIPDEYIFPSTSILSFVQWCYNDVFNNPQFQLLLQRLNEELPTDATNESIAPLSERAILASTNNEVDILNNIALAQFPGDDINLLSADEILDEDETLSEQYSVEFLNSMEFSGIPSHKLIVKLGVPLLLLRNIDPKKGLCNGTRVVLIHATLYKLTVSIVTDSHAGNTAVLPRINFTPANNNNSALPFKLQRRQFPVRLAFAMTIHKAQGQSLKKVGLYLPKPCFSHGQLYVALSRSGIREQTKIFIRSSLPQQGCQENKYFTANVVWKEILT